MRRPLDLLCGTTVGTNALLQRRGGRVVLVTTAGFEDVLEIGRQARPKLYDFFGGRRAPLVPRERRFGLRERIGADGEVVLRPSPKEIRALIRRVRAARPDAVAVCFLFSFNNFAHEKAIAGALRRAGLAVTASHEVFPEFREFERTSTTVVNAYLIPVMSGYLAAIDNIAQRVSGGASKPNQPQSRVRMTRSSSGSVSAVAAAPNRAQSRVRVMQSNGGIVSARVAASEPVRTILSGPAGGVLGAEYVANLAGFDKIISFDMGGTSTDVALLEGGARTTNESIVDDVPVSVPMLDIHTVGAGGGSIARIDRGGALRVGPESAGADPGPIAYGKGEQPTVTDAHLVLGRLGRSGLLGGEFPLDADRARRFLDRARRQIATVCGAEDFAPGNADAGSATMRHSGRAPQLLNRGRKRAPAMRSKQSASMRSAEEFAQGTLDVVEATMERAIRVISVERGHDPRDYSLVAFGGAGGLHACALAAALEMPRVLIPKLPGGLSALGILRADVVKDFSQTILTRAREVNLARQQLRKSFSNLEAAGERHMRAEGFAPKKLRAERSLDIRYVGQSDFLKVAAGGDFTANFHREHQRRYGYADETREIEIVNVCVRLIGMTPKPAIPLSRKLQSTSRQAIAGREKVYFHGRWVSTPIYERQNLRPGNRVAGPAIITDYSATTVVLAGWQARVDAFENLILTRELSPAARRLSGSRRRGGRR